MLEKLEQIDQKLMLALNSKHSPFFDVAMQTMSNKFVWIPLYLLLFYFIYKEYGKKYTAIYFLLSLVAVGFTDWVSVNGFKEVFMRFRPCHNLEIGHLIHIVDGKCGGKYGFVSSHASNHYAVAWMLGMGLFKRSKWWLFGLLLWAAIIGYSRIYLGVHYPSDVVAGSLLGTGIALAVITTFHKLKPKSLLND